MSGAATGSDLPPARAERPSHVPENLVVDFDVYNLAGAEDDVQLAYHAVQQSSPDLFWTPFNGGHWVATRADDLEVVLGDSQRFSHRQYTVPWMSGLPRQIPLSLEPPEHTPFRRPLTQALLPRVVNQLSESVRSITVSLIEGFRTRGECEFVSEFAKVFPIFVFFDMADLPREDRKLLLPLADSHFRRATQEERQRSHKAVSDYLARKILERRETPGDDLLSKLVNADIDGEKISLEDATSMATNSVLGGLDTVAAMLGFVARFLATHADHRHQLIEHLDDERFLKNAVEELLRRHGISNMSRCVAYDMEFKGVHLKEGDMIMPPNMLVGLDDRRNKDPLTVDFNRASISHAVFGTGPHTCPGAVLARRELQIFLEEWLRRIPEFQIKPGTRPVLSAGVVNSVQKMELCWPASG